MKILIVMQGFFPGKKYGGPPVSVDNFCTLMREGNECFIVTHDHDKGDEQPYEGITPGWNDRGNCRVLYLSDADYCRRTFERIADEIAPDVIYLQSFFERCVLPCLRIGRKRGIRTILAPRGEVCRNALNLKKYKKYPYIVLTRLLGLYRGVFFQSTSGEETEALRRLLGAPAEHIYELTNIPSLPKASYPEPEKTAGEGKFIFLSRIHPKKNLLFAIRCFAGVKEKAALDIYGPIEDEGYWAQCREEIAKLPACVTVRYCGLIPHDAVHEAFSRYDAFLFPTLSENYGHVIAEALMVGTPVILSDQTPWTDVNGTGAGWAFSLDARDGFAGAISEVCRSGAAEQRAMRNSAAAFVRSRCDTDRLRGEYEAMCRPGGETAGSGNG